jgi:CRP-like cAMP-binding protein
VAIEFLSGLGYPVRREKAMILPSVRLWYEGKSKELEEVLKEAERFHLSGYARLAFPGSGQNFILLQGGAVREVLEIGPANKPAQRNIRDLWGKSKIKDGLLQVFEIPPEVDYLLSRLDGRRALPQGKSPADLKKLVLSLRENDPQTLVDVQTPQGKGLLVVSGKAIQGCWFSENEGFTYADLEGFKKLYSNVVKTRQFSASVSQVSSEAPEGIPWLPLLLGGAEYSGPVSVLKNRLAERYGHHYAPGTVHFKEGDPSNDFYIIISGQVIIYKERKGRRKILAELGPGEFFGEMAFFNKAPRSATAESVEESLLIKITTEEFKTLLYNSYEFRITIIKKLARRLKDTMTEIVKLWEDPRAVYMEKVIFQIISSDQKWQDEGIPPGLLMQEISNASGMRFSEIDALLRKLLESGKLEFVRGKMVLKEAAYLP